MNWKLHSRIRQNVICAGSSGIILAFAHIHPELWPVSFIALLPFLWRLNNVGRRGAVGLGLILASTYLFATCLSDLMLAPAIFLIKLLSLNIAFAIFAYAINRLKRHVGFNSIVIVLLWLPLGFVLIHSVGMGDILSIPHTGSNLIIGFGSLIGVLLGSLIIILGNSLILLYVRYIERKISSGRIFLPAVSKERKYPPTENIVVERICYFLPEPRSPPT
jgi:apolipoprotein N-acyltransferase